jgi:formiminoglutamate deiminase
MLRVDGRRLYLPALATAHSHAFQRGMRGRAQRPGPCGADDFWTWRQAMYEAADALTPESIHAVSRVAFGELRRRGILTVGEFHYVHHAPGGAPYADRTVMADAVIRAALDAGLRIALLRVVYARAGAGRAPEGTQRRFSDARLDEAFADVDALASRYRGEPNVRVGIAPHSVRAVPPDWLVEIASFSSERAMPVHMHVAEQPAEVEACVAETGKRPVELLAERGLLSSRFVAVHATHLAPHEPSLLGQAGARACLCPTTERDLGDGLADVSALFGAGVELCVGVDSHVAVAPLEELRMVELGERLRTGRRVVLKPSAGTLAELLWNVGSGHGARACGFVDPGGEVEIDRDHPDLALVRDEDLLDAIVFGGQADVVRFAGVATVSWSP